MCSIYFEDYSKESRDSFFKQSEDESLSSPTNDVVTFPQQQQKMHRKTKVKWTPEEDELLRESVKVNGLKNWTTVSGMIPGRNPKQCRERWTSKLDPNLSHQCFTPQEDATIIMKHQALGPLWAKIARFLPGRSSIAIKNRFNLLLRHKTNATSSGFQPPLYLYKKAGRAPESIVSQASILSSEADNLLLTYSVFSEFEEC